MATSSGPRPLGEARQALSDQLHDSILGTLRRHAGASIAAKTGLADELADIARGYADAVQARALASLADSVGELVMLARAHLGDAEPSAARRPRKAAT